VAALAVRADPGQEGLQAVHDAAQVHREPEIPVFVRDALERALDADAGVVHEHVHLAELALGLGRSGPHRRTIGDVDAYRMDAARLAALFETRERFVDVILAQVREHDLHARIDEHARDAKPDAARPTGDECDFSRYVLHPASPRCTDTGQAIGATYRSPAHSATIRELLASGDSEPASGP
jgi:hypothetical protein